MFKTEQEFKFKPLKITFESRLEQNCQKYTAIFCLNSVYFDCY